MTSVATSCIARLPVTGPVASLTHLAVRDKLLHHLLQGVLIIDDHLPKTGVLPVTMATKNTVTNTPHHYPTCGHIKRLVIALVG